MDGEQIENVLYIASEEFPQPFFNNKDPIAIFQLLRDFRTLLLVLHAAIQIGTGILDRPRGRGRQSSPYVQQALVLMDAWEIVTARQFSADLPLLILKRVPTPKRLDVKDREIITKQPSTNFIRIALRMIDPKIKDAQVFTAIKNALTLRDEIYEFARTNPRKSLAGKLKVLGRFKTRHVPVRKKAAQTAI